MPDVTYKIVYVVDNAKALKGLAEIDAALLKTQGNIQKTGGMLKSIGQNTPGLTQAIGMFRKLDAALASQLVAASKAEKALAGVGKDNRAVASLTSRLKDLEDELKNVTVQAGNAQAGLAGVGGGVKLPGSGGGGGSGSGAPTGLVGRTVAGLGRHMAYAAFRNTVSAAGEGARDRRQFFSDAADLASNYRKDLQEVAVLEGKNSVGDDDVRKDLAFQKRTLLNAEESREFRLEYGGAVAFGKTKGNISDQTSGDLEREGAKFGLRYDLDPKTTGRMAGLLSNYGKVPSAAAGVGQMAAAAEQLNVFGIGSVKSMMSPMVGLAADMLSSEEGGRFKSFEDMAARFGNTTSIARSPAAAGTQIRQANRLLRKFNGQEEEAFLRKVGITPENDYETSLRKIAPHVTGPDGDHVLMENGFGNSTERDSVIKQAKMNAVVDAQLKDPRIASARAGAIARNDEFAGTTQGQQRAAENSEFASTVEAGMTGERLKAARASARAAMIAEGRLKSRGIGESLTDKLRSGISAFGGVSGEDLRVDMEAVERLADEGKKVGIDVHREFPDLDITRGGRGMRAGTSAGTDEAAFQADFAKAAGRIDAAKAAKKAGAALNQLGDALNQAGGGGGNNGPAAGNGGAGVNPGRR